MTFRRTLIATLLAATPAFGQFQLAPKSSRPQQQPPRAPGQPELTPNQRMVTLSSGQHVFETMALTGPDGKVVRVEGQLDLLALQRNPLVNDQARERLRGAIRDWNAELERAVIDNLDFLEQIEPLAGGPGLVDQLESTDNNAMRTITQVMAQLGAAGNLSNSLNAKGLLTPDQYALNQHIVADYLQKCMAEVAPNTEQITTPEQSANRTNRYNRFLYSVQAMDAVAAWHRMLAQAAPNLDKVVAGLNLDAATASKVADQVAAAKSAVDDPKRRAAVRAVLEQLSFPQRQAAVRAARDLAPPFDPFPARPTADATTPPAKTGG